MKNQIRKFLIEKNCDGYKIDDEDIVSQSYPENYHFIRQEENGWIYGVSRRDEETIKKSFLKEEEALLYLLYLVYTSKIQINLMRGYMSYFRTLSKDELEVELKNVFTSKELEMLKVYDDKNIVYIDKYYISNNMEYDISKFHYVKLFALRAFEKTKEELVMLGVNPLDLDNYFRFEKLILE